MKNAMKKLMALALVAVMLVSAVPFAASAATLEGGCDDADPAACTNDFPNHNALCAKACRADNCYPGSQDDWDATHHIPGCATLAAHIAEEEAARLEAEEAAKRDTNNCTMQEDCPVVVPYHKEGCLAIYKSEDAIDDGKACTNSFDCPHRGNLHTAGCPVLPCSGDANCDHGGFDHKAGCPLACNGKSNCPQAAKQDARYHVAGCASLTKEDESTGSNNNGGSNTETPAAQKATAYIYVGTNSTASKIYQQNDAFSIAYIVDRFDNEDSKHYAFEYYTLDGINISTNDTAVVQPGQTAHVRVKVTESKLNVNKVYLQIFLNNDFDTPAKALNVTDTAIKNGLNLNGNVKDLILEYFSAKTSAGVKIDGMYPSTNWVAKFLEDEKVSKLTADQVIEMREDGYVVYNIMVTNAKLKSSSTADSSNPKTGDTIFVPVAIMTFSAVSLAAVAFYLNKKHVY